MRVVKILGVLLLLGALFDTWLQHRHRAELGHLPPSAWRATTYFASAIGGASEMTLLAERHGARTDLVAAAHSVRLVLVVLTLPFAMQWAQSHWGLQVDVRLLPGPLVAQWPGLLWLALATAGGADIHWARDVYGVLEARGQVPVQRPLAVLNTAFATDGLLIRVTGKAAKPVSLIYVHNSDSSDAILHHCVKVEAGAEITITAQLVGPNLRIVVSDTGPGLQMSAASNRLSGCSCAKLCWAIGGTCSSRVL